MLTIILDSYDQGYLLGRLIGLVIGAAIYFVPAIVAFSRKSERRVAILIIDLLLGWTVIGWIGALVWAIVSRSEKSLGQGSAEPQRRAS